MAGEVFNAGHAERGNDLPGLLSTSKAERVEGGFRITGHKMFGSAGPGLDALRAARDVGRRRRRAEDRARLSAARHAGYRIVETWDTMGMRATRSDDVMLEGAFVPDRYIARIVPAGGADAFVLGHLRLGAAGFRQHLLRRWRGARSTSPCRRCRQKTSLAVTRSMAYHPEVQHAVARDGAGARSDRAAHREGRRGLVERRRSRRGLAGEDRLGQVSCRRGLLADRRSGDGGLGRRRHVPGRTSLSGCSATPAAARFHPGEHIPGARDRRQDDARHRPWRAAALGVATARAHSTRRQLADQRLIRGDIIRPSPGSAPRTAAHPPAAGARAAHPPAPATRCRPNPSDRRTAPAGHSARA